MFSKLIGSILTVFLLSTLCGAAELNCPGRFDDIYAQAKTKDSLICVLGADKPKLYFIKKSGVIENKALLKKEYIEENILRMYEVNSVAYLHFEYPRDDYLIGIDLESGKIIKAIYSIRLPPAEENEVISGLDLSTKPEILNSLSIKSANMDILFNKKNLRLLTMTDLKITSNKAFLWDSSQASKPTEIYLSKGDRVAVIEYENNKLKIIYRIKGKDTVKWISLRDIM